METGNDDGKRKDKDAVDGSSNVGEESVIGSELADQAQAGFEDEITA